MAGEAKKRERLEKLLGMLGSAFEGERASAALLLSNMAKAEKLSIVDLCKRELGGVRPTSTIRVEPRKPSRRQGWGEDYLLGELRNLRVSKDLTAWERQFIASVLSKYDSDEELSDAQRRSAEEIITKYEAGM